VGEVRDASPALLLGRYRSEAIVGEGAFGRVVRAFDMRLKRPVAIKTLKRAMAQTDLGHFRQLEDRFIREALTWQSIWPHPNVMLCYLTCNATAVLNVLLLLLRRASLC